MSDSGVEDELVLETAKRFAPALNEGGGVNEADPHLVEDFRKIPDKLAFKIGEAAELIGVKPYVLRYWETEFDALKPQKAKNNQRFYTRRDVELLLMIKKLLYRDRFSIEGARSALRKLKQDTKKAQTIQGAAARLEDVRDRMEDLLFDIRRLKEQFR